MSNFVDQISIQTVSGFVPQQSSAESKRYVFFYEIEISNGSNTACQLMSRHWIINDANNKMEEVYGEGVVGEQPVILPGEKFKYTSGAVLETEMGTMEGRYFFVQKSVNDDDKNEFEILIPKFILSVPRTIH